MKKLSLFAITGSVCIGLISLSFFHQVELNKKETNIAQQTIQIKKHPIVIVPIPKYDLKKYQIIKLPTIHKQVKIVNLLSKN